MLQFEFSLSTNPDLEAQFIVGSAATAGHFIISSVNISLPGTYPQGIENWELFSDWFTLPPSGTNGLQYT